MQVTSGKKGAGPLSLAWMLAQRDLKNRYVSSYAGIAWNVGVPLLYAVINVTVFSILMSHRMGNRYGDVPFALFYFVPFSLWTVFTEVTSRSTGILREYSYLISKIAFPVWVLPLIPFASAMISQGIILAIIVVLMIVNHMPISATLLVFPVIWLFSLLITMGAAYTISSLSVFIPDMVPVVPVVTNILFWLTPILYPVTMVESSNLLWVRNLILTYNPFFYMVEASRESVLPGLGIHWNYVLVFGAVSVIAFLIGAMVFRKLKSGFADVL
jgi:lipopolysaccharide transport system permease protein